MTTPKRDTKAELQERIKRIQHTNSIPLAVLWSEEQLAAVQEMAAFLPVQQYGPAMIPLRGEVGALTGEQPVRLLLGVLSVDVKGSGA